MAAFAYRARRRSGELVQGRLEAGSERDAVVRLRHQGLLVLAVEPDRELRSALQWGGSALLRPVGRQELALFARQFATMVAAGLPVLSALQVLARQSLNPTLSRGLAEVAAAVEGGEGLAEAFARQRGLLPAGAVPMIAAGEVGGILEQALEQLATQLEKEEATREKVRSALVYPAIVSGVAVLVLLLMILFVVPSFVQVYADLGAELPALTRLLIQGSAFLKASWWAVLALGAAAVYAGWRLLRTDSGALLWDRLLLRVPIIGPTLRKQSMARFARTLAGLLGSGVPILTALTVVERTVGNRAVAAAVRESLEAVRQGEGMTGALQRSHLFPPMLVAMVNVGEETGALESMLGKVASFFEAEVQRAAERLTASLEPLIIAGLALTVGTIVASLMLPIFSLWELM